MNGLNAEPHIGIDEDLIEGLHPKFSDFSVDPTAAAAEMHVMGMTDGSIAETDIFVSSESGALIAPGLQKNVIETVKYVLYTELTWGGKEVSFFPSHTADVLNRPAESGLSDRLSAKVVAKRVELDQLQRADVADLSSHLVRGLSKRADMAVMGCDAVEAERKRAERLIKISKSIPRALGTAAVTGASAVGAYLNHKYNVLHPEVVVDAIAVVSSAVTGWISWESAKGAIRRKYLHNTVAERWPDDLRAKKRAEDYRRRRDAGEAPELVRYTVRSMQQ